MKIRKARESDFPALLRIGHDFFKLNPYNEYSELDEGSLTDTFRNLIATQILIVMESDDGEVVGTAAAMMAPVFWNKVDVQGIEIFWWVDPEHRKDGNGKKLRQALEKIAKSRGVRFWNMVSMETSEPEKLDKMYAKAGFKRLENIYMKVL